MAFKIITVLALVAVASISGAAINNIPGFENFTHCKSEDCWHETKKAMHTLFKKGYEPYGIKKIDPLFIGNTEYELPNAKYVFKNIEVTGFDTIDDVKFKVDKEKKIIYQDATFDLHYTSDMEAVYNLDKEYKVNTVVHVTYPGVVISLTRPFDVEKREFEGKEETFIIPKEYELTFKKGGKPTYKYSDEFQAKLKEGEALNKWYKDHAEVVAEKRQEGFETIVKQFVAAYMGVLTQFDKHYPVSRFFSQFEHIHQ